MSIFKDKTLKSVAEAAAKIMAQESSHGTHPKTDKEKDLAALAHPKDKITHKDVLVGRGVLKKEEVDMGQADARKTTPSSKEQKEKVFANHRERMKKLSTEEVELDEELTAWQKVQRKKEEMEDKRRERMEREDMPAPEKKKTTLQKVAGHRYGGSKQKDETNEGFLPFTQMIESYTNRGLKALSGIIREEPDNEQWTKELKDQEATAAGKKKSASVSAPATQGVKTMKEDEELTLEDFTPEEIEEFMQTEEFEQLDELSKETLKNYVKAASDGGLKQFHRKHSIALAKQKIAMKEEEQLDELSKSTLGSYIRKAAGNAFYHAHTAGIIGGGTAAAPNPDSVKSYKKADKRIQGIRRATRKMEEDVEVIDFTDVYNVQKYTIKDEDIQQERALTEPEMEKKEKIVKGMKKGLEGFKQRYGERAKSVMYATATARAKED